MTSAEDKTSPVEDTWADDDDGNTLVLPSRQAGVRFFPSVTRKGSEPGAITAEGPIPNRYEIRVVEDRRALVCREAPGVSVLVDRHFSFSEVEARKLGERTVLLDGAGCFAPLIDDSRHLYNLDHHEGCPRAFTLATCEQALIMVKKGLKLAKGDWTVYANEPDLDTVLAIWVLLNYRRVLELDARGRDKIFPLLRLEGAIDANGPEIAEFCGLPQDRIAEEKARINQLFARELAAKKEGWKTLDLPRYTLDMLLQIDRLVYTSSDFSDYESIEEEYGHVEISEDKVAVVCRDSAGIYEVEKRLKKVWGDRLGLIALEGAPHKYTLRLSAGLSGISLEQAYERLNLLDPAVDGRPPEKKWGGGDEIGGSPRPDGTGLLPREIGKILKITYQRTRPWQKLQRYAVASLWTAILATSGALAILALRQLSSPPAAEMATLLDLATVGAVMVVGSWLLTLRLSRGWTWLFGWRRPAGEDYLILTPLVLLAALGGGIWAPSMASYSAEPLAAAAGALLVMALGLTLLFPGLVHGFLVLEAPVQRVGGRFFVSRPALMCGLLYGALTFAAASVGLILPAPGFLTTPWDELIPALAGWLGGTALGMMRERSLSIWPAFGSLMAGGALRLIIEFAQSL